MKKLFSLVLSILLITSLLPPTSLAQEQSKADVELWNVVKPLETTVTFLNTGAHPDDERSDFLAYLSRGLGVKTASLIANRGEGGQNAIGNELGNALGIIRSNEMIEAAKINGVKAYHLSETTSDAIYDFGFSKSPDETLAKWGEDVVYERLIKFIRTYQPDIVMPSFENVDSQHGHHRLMAILSEQAYQDAADPTIFPEQLENGLEPWQIKKFYLPANENTATTSIEIGDYDPIYDMSYPQLGEASRYLHKSQGMGNDIPVAPRKSHLKLIKSAIDTDSTDLFAGVPYDFHEWADLIPASNLNKQLDTLKVNVTISNEGKQKIQHIEASLLTPENWKHEGVNKVKHLKPGESKAVTFHVTVPTDEKYYQPYDEAVIKTQLTFKENGVETTSVIDLENTVSVLPEFSVTPDPVNITVNTANIQDEIPVTVKMKNYDHNPKNATVSLNLPDGWASKPATADVSFTERYEEKEVSFILNPTSSVTDSNFTIEATAIADGKTFNTTVQEIKYDHINDSYFMYPSNINGVAFELLKPENLKVGYIDSGFDTIADSLLNAGFDIKKLTPEDLATGDLSQFDTIVAGIRSTLGRPDVLHNNARLLEYVENGGHLVMQYVTSGDPWNNNKFTPPYSLTIGSPSIRVRVTDENAKVTVTQPEHALFNYPNKINESDWDHWVQERALYFPSAWDESYETFVSMADPGEEPFTSGILMAEYGEGTFLYTNLVFYRQINAQVPGGYRIFTNLISYGANN